MEEVLKRANQCLPGVGGGGGRGDGGKWGFK